MYVLSMLARKKAIGLDDLLTDHYKQKSQILEREKKRAAKAKKNYNSDEDENGKEALLSNIVNSCQNQAYYNFSYSCLLQFH